MKNKLSRRQFGELAVSTLAGASLTACMPSRGNVTMKDIMDEIALEEVNRDLEVEGDPSFGTIYSIRQYHAAPGGPVSRDSVTCVFNYQLRILQELIRLKCDAVFLERCARSDCFTPNDLALLKRFNVFDESYMASLSDTERGMILRSFRKIFYELGAAPYYALFNPNAKFHGTKTEREGQIEEDYLNFMLQSDDPDMMESEEFERMQDKREEWAIREMMLYFEKNRGAVAALIYGADHGFCEELEEYSPRPRLYTVDFPGFLKKGTYVCNPRGKKLEYSRQCSGDSTS